ncbi:CIC11C00000005342 [Sungouiella intermedia]|uniref:CIC11C00000005342 n=1 Tax=Sungouiella intermedia TaxID=45354 RepID=A0A1L0BUX9_9ASCO|nr:CIC11C00000005342 [[Candida] intermedia]
MDRRQSVSLSQAELVYVKSKVYLHPTTSKKDNVVGYLSLAKPGGPSTNKDILLSFTPESTLSKEELKIYEDADISEELALELLALLFSGNKRTKKPKLPIVNKPPLFSAGYAFSVSLSYIYLIQFRTPSLGWWYGSIVLHTKSGEKLPVVFFHDDESPLTLQRQKVKNQRFDPFGEDGLMYWGGQDFLQALSLLINVDRSTVEPSVYLVDPSLADLRNFSPFKEGSSVGKLATTSKAKTEPFKLPDVNKLFATAKWRVLETVATFGLRTKNQVIDLVDEHVPQVVVKQLINKPEVQKIGNDFDSARVYLAKWAAQVKEEAEQSQRKFMLEDAVYARINLELGTDKELLTPEEISNASRRKPVSKVEWDGLFDESGRLTVTVEEVKSRVFHGGLADDVRKEAWPFLLGVFPWDSLTKERATIFQSLQYGYSDYKRRWVDDEEKRQTEFWKDQKVRIEKDIHRNDRNLEIFKDNKRKDSTSSQGGSSANQTTSNERESSPETPDEDEDWNLSHITNRHLFSMREILLTYNEYNVNLGYVQGMTDLLSPIYVVFQSETMAFWAFAGFMERMERNFVRDQSGMKRQMLVLNELVQFMLPNLFRHLEKCESTDLFFFFRMLLVWYKREFEWEQVNTLWEVLWTDFYSSQYHLFVALAVLSDNERIIIQNLLRFDEVLKYMNDLLGKMNLHDLLVRAELLFLRFRRMVDLIDRENLIKRQRGELYEAQVNPDLRELLSKKMVIQKEVERPEGVGGG